ncbi:MAG: ABC transporter substrate-binding protein, partial [Thermodesulfobacteriota bacterium]
MKRILVMVISLSLVLGTAIAGAKPIVIGVATDTEILDGFATIRGLKMAVEEINSAGGVNVKG